MVKHTKIRKILRLFEEKSIDDEKMRMLFNKLVMRHLEKMEQRRNRKKVSLEYETWDVKESSSILFKKLRSRDWYKIIDYLDIFSIYSLKISEKYLYKMLEKPIFYKNIVNILSMNPGQVGDAIYQPLV